MRRGSYGEGGTTGKTSSGDVESREPVAEVLRAGSEGWGVRGGLGGGRYDRESGW